MKKAELDNAPTTPRNRHPEHAAEDQFLSLLTTDILSIRELPSDPIKINEIATALDLKIWYDFVKTRLSDPEQSAVKQSHGPVNDLNPSIRIKFDYYLIDAAQQHGTMLFNSILVRQRLWSWQCGEEHGDRKIKALLDQIHRSALVRLGKAKGRVNRRYKSAKPVWITEITELQIRVREKWPATADAVKQFINSEIEASPKLFPHLRSNKAALFLFLDDDRALAFRGSDFKRVKGDLTPTRFFEQWVAAAEGRDPESVRQCLSKLRPYSL